VKYLLEETIQFILRIKAYRETHAWIRYVKFGIEIVRYLMMFTVILYSANIYSQGVEAGAMFCKNNCMCSLYGLDRIDTAINSSERVLPFRINVTRFNVSVKSIFNRSPESNLVGLVPGAITTLT